MKTSSSGAKRLTGIVFAAILFAAMVFNGWVYIVYVQNFGVYAAAETANDFEIRSKLLMDALRGVGSCSAAEAAQLWASGLRERSAALQYAALTENLKVSYEKGLEKNYPNWVTGMSSPWVDSYTVTKSTRASSNRYIFTIVFSTKTSTGPTGEYPATLTIDREGGYWRVSHIDADKRLLPYIGSLPK